MGEDAVSVPQSETPEPRDRTPRGRADILAGLAVALVGIAVIWIASGYSLGTLRRMGPGYVPVVLGGVLTVTGVLIALLRPDVTLQVPRQRPRPIVCVLGALLAFILLGRFGILPAILVAVPVAALAERKASLAGALLLAVGTAALVVAIFVWALGVPLPLVRF